MLMEDGLIPGKKNGNDVACLVQYTIKLNDN